MTAEKIRVADDAPGAKVGRTRSRLSTQESHLHYLHRDETLRFCSIIEIGEGKCNSRQGLVVVGG